MRLHEFSLIIVVVFLAFSGLIGYIGTHHCEENVIILWPTQEIPETRLLDL